jgi:hypothetical protein
MSRHKLLTCHAVAAGLALAAATSPAAVDAAEPFKITNVHFETNASACDMGIQISFDTDGVSEGSVKDPNGQVVYQFGAVGDPEVTHNITEGFQERVEPQIVELEQALGCERDLEEPEVFLTELLAAWPEGKYVFTGQSSDANFRGFANLTHKIPAGPVILTPEDGDVVSADEHLLIRWTKVTEPIMPALGPVEIVGYHVLVADVTRPEPPPGQTKIQFDADLRNSAPNFLVAKQFLRPNRIYELEILATEKGGNQTITEGGVFCTLPMLPAACVKPE